MKVVGFHYFDGIYCSILLYQWVLLLLLSVGSIGCIASD